MKAAYTKCVRAVWAADGGQCFEPRVNFLKLEFEIEFATSFNSILALNKIH